MGRGARTEAQTKTAQGLLFGPRRLATIKPLGGQAGKDQVDDIISRMEESGNFEEALALLVRYNDEEENEHLDRLAEAMTEPVANCSPDDLDNLCSAIGSEIDRDDHIPAFNKLKDGLGAAAVSNAVQGQLGQPALDFVCRDNPLCGQIRDHWADAVPSNLMAYGTGSMPAGYTNLSDDERFKLRAAVYRRLNDIYDETTPWGFALNDKIIEDIGSKRPAVMPLIKKIEKALEDRGGSNLFAAPFMSSNPENGPQVSAEQLGQILQAMPDQHKIKLFLTDYAVNQHYRHYQSTLAGVEAVLSDNSQAISAASRGPDLSIDQHKRLDKAAHQLIDNFAEAVIDGKRDEVIKEYHRALARELAGNYDPSKLNSNTRLFDAQARQPTIALPQYDHNHSLWEGFRKKYLRRALLPDRKIEITQDQWVALLTDSLKSNYDNPFSAAISGKELINGLHKLYHRYEPF